ncbi:MAG: Membrane protein [Parcubacteria group bacterium GW2011_GWA1_38_7]|nr:MAG: Membrane protein [Parcubacteria group bacterium GW2011_GWA1_38_7]
MSAYLVNMIIPNVYLSFLIPVLAAYLGTIVLVYIFSVRELGKIFAIATTALFISFYPFLDWSTYFMTDTIGAFFWLLQLFFIYKFIKTHTNKWLVLFAAVLAISLLNREQNVLMVPLLGLFQVLGWAFKMPVKNKNSALMLFGISIFVVFVFIVTSFILGQKNILDTLVYTQNSYGLKNNTYTAKGACPAPLVVFVKCAFHIRRI